MNSMEERPKFWSENTTPSGTTDREASWKDVGTSMNAISFGFVATAVLVSMFLIMAIFEHLLGPRPSHPSSQTDDQESMEMGQQPTQTHPLGKLSNSESVATPYPVDVSVLMPGQIYPTYLAQPAPHPCPREGIYWPSHDHHAFSST
ncbi:uncharacterized protein LOC103704878 [Phoenix dactylifera]|uniref:Uncharacterized protein LOC103704878 n=1 Tax=Phoenix dactylifera TaxID=42345 RepID=A0A8B7BW11_PHODC|nr:uncharacterized protein LOC103704878 [Phoenix dactylifera]